MLKITTFLNKQISDSEMSKLLTHTNIENMRKNKYVNNEEFISELQKISKSNFQGFINKGEVGGHKKVMSVDMINKFDKWIEENTKGSGLSFL